MLLNKMNTTVDGEFQRYSVESGAYIREHFFGPDPRLRKLVEGWSDEDLRWLPRGGHDYRKLYAAYKSATDNLGSGAPTAILCKTIKGWTLGPEVEGRNATHQIKKLSGPQLRVLRDRLYLHDEIPDAALEGDVPPYYRPPEDSVEYQYMMERRRALDGPLPRRTTRTRRAIELPADTRLQGGARRLGRPGRVDHDGVHPAGAQPGSRPGLRAAGGADHPGRGPHVRHGLPVPGDQDLRRPRPEVRAGRRASSCSRTPSPRTARSWRKGITEAGAMSSFIAAGTSYASRGVPMVPFYIFYSMFGFQRVGDLIWQAADSRARGFLLGATAGRTTLLGEGLQHQDGHSLVLASTVPPCQAYDPAFAYEMATIIRHGTERMYGKRPGGRLLLPDPLQRELPDAGDARRRSSRGSSTACTAGPRRPDRAVEAGHAAVLRLGAGSGPPGRRGPGRALRRRRRAVVGHQLQGAAGRGPGHRAGEPPASRPGAAGPARAPAARPTRPGRSSPSPTS